MFGTLSEERVDALVNNLESLKEVIPSTVKSGNKDVLVTLKETVNISCRINMGYIERNMPVLFEKLSDRCFLSELDDDIETNFCSLEALGVDHDSYSSIFPTLVEEIPESIWLAMFRFGADKLDMDIKNY